MRTLFSACTLLLIEHVSYSYATAKSALIGFTKTLALEGKKYGIIANCVAPTAGTSMTATIWGQEQIDYYKPDYLAPFTVFLASEANTSSGGLYEISRGWSCKYRWQRTAGYAVSHTTGCWLNKH